MAGRVRTGIGGWTFPPWRGVFYPPGLRQSDELAHAARHLGAIEVNGTYYSLMKPKSYAEWRAATPEGFVFTIKGSRFCTNRKVLADAGEALDRFFGQGLEELGNRLGPVFWQFMATKRFDPDDFGAFLKLLPRELAGLGLRHAVEVRHESFACAEFVDLARAHNVAICLADHAQFPSIPDITSDFIYARLMTGRDDVETGYPPDGLDLWARRLSEYAKGEVPADLPAISPVAAPISSKDVFAFVIHEGKVRAPAAAMALAERLRSPPG